MQTLVNEFLGFSIIKNNDGVILVDKSNGCNALPGAMCYRNETDEESIFEAKKDAFKLFMIKHSKEFGASLYYRMQPNSGKAYGELSILKRVLEKENIILPHDIVGCGFGNSSVGLLNEFGFGIEL